MKNGLPGSERQALAEAGFTDQEIADLAAVIQLNAADALASVDFDGQAKKVGSMKGAAPQKSVLKIGAGVLLIGVDIGSRFIPLLNAVTAFEAVTSIANGVVFVADGLKPEAR